MKLLRILLIFLSTASAFCFTANDAAKTVSSDGSAADTQNAINYADGKNQDDWVITVGTSGGSYTWATTVTVPTTLAHNYIVQGAGSGVTVTSSHNNYQSFGLSTTNGKLAQLTNFTFRNTGSQGGAFLVIDQPQAAVSARNSFRVHHVTFQDCAAFAIRIGEANMNEGTAFGLIDHCTFSNTTTSNGIYVFAGNNANQWTGNMTWGTVDTVTIEDCTFTLTATTVEGNPAIDSAYNGARWSARHNTFNNWVCVLHGADSAPTSTMQVEFHHNVTTVDDPVDYGLYCRGGCIMASDNTFTTVGAGSYNQSFKFANDSPGGFQKVGQGAVSGVATRLGAYFWNNHPQGIGGMPAGLALNTDVFAVPPGAGLPTTSYTELVYPHPLAVGGGGGDVTPPTPNPMTFSSAPASAGSSSISMTASTATDAASPPVAYFFHETSGFSGGSDSGWQSSPSYTDTGLFGSTTYSYQVKARDAALNETAYSSIQSATTSSASAVTYYVDQTAGNDTNNGTSPSTPWKNVPGMHGTSAHTGSHTLVAGNIVYLDRSDIWLVSSAGDGGMTMVAGVHYIGNSYDPEGAGSGIMAIIRANGTCEAGGVRINDDDPTNPTWIEGVDIDGAGQNGSGVDINHRFWNTGLTGAAKRIENCLVRGWVGDGGAGNFRYGIIVSDGSPDASGVVSNVEILNNTLTNPPRDGICLYPGATGRVTNALVRGNTVSGIKTDPSYAEGHGILVKGDVRNSIVEYNYAHDVNSSALFINGPETGTGPGPTGVVYRFNILQTNDNNGVIRVFGTGNKTGDIYGNIVYGGSVSGGLNFAGNSGTMTFNAYNNTFIIPVIIDDPTATGTLNFRNNLIAVGNATPLVDSGVDIDTHTNNLYNRTSGTTLVSSGASAFTAANLSTYEATALSASPGLVNAANPPTGFSGAYPTLTPNTTGLSLQTGSPAINNGVDLGTSFNGSINSQTRVAPWDIGAYESGAVADTTPPTVSSASINAAGNQLTITCNEAIRIGTGGSGGMTISASGGAVTLGAPTVTGGTSLVYPISGRVIAGSETITRTYVQPTNGIEDLAGNDLASFSAQSVTNNAAADTTPPTPNPMTFSSMPSAASSFSVTMTASLATDAGPGTVEYYFDETSGNAGGTDSGWITSRTYTNNGLSPGIQYTYRVMARDAAPTPNVTSPSASVNVTTPIMKGARLITPINTSRAGIFNM